ncbi:MAG: hypothetical protein HWQ43_22545 [Nostoc sp. JL31]|uniref:hypothetical protein n=1 Tax=Nostoc sp. JL31 TaxID=2815395 RepID=UPI0025E8139F|nr:hypothetical protein [Nostoc sp. JL31]MBN3891815.1 hypothetical protein [Nostoc sp. JL31]
MTIPLFSGDARRSLVMQRGTDSYGEGGRKLQYSVGFSLRHYANEPTLIARNLQPALDEVFHARS